MHKRFSTLARAFLAAILLVLAPGVETALCLCVDHISAHVASRQDDCCAAPGESEAGKGLAVGSTGFSDCDACIDVVLPGQTMPIVRNDAPAPMPVLAKSPLHAVPASHGMFSASAASCRYPVPLLSPAQACDILRT